GRPAHLRPRRRHVSRQGRGDGGMRCHLRAAAASLHPGAALGRADPGPAPRAGAAPDRAAGRCAQPGGATVGLPLSHPLLQGAGGLCDDGATADLLARRARRGVPFCREPRLPGNLSMDAFIYGGVRTAFGRFGGALASIRPDDLLARAIAGLLERTRVAPAAIEDVVAGCANQAGEDSRNVARHAALLAGLPIEVGGSTVNRLCASGLAALGGAARAGSLPLAHPLIPRPLRILI